MVITMRISQLKDVSMMLFIFPLFVQRTWHNGLEIFGNCCLPVLNLGLDEIRNKTGRRNKLLSCLNKFLETMQVEQGK